VTDPTKFIDFWATLQNKSNAMSAFRIADIRPVKSKHNAVCSWIARFGLNSVWLKRVDRAG
jgi:hypothetical protein